MDANYTAAGPSMRGKLLIRMEGQEIGAEFDLQKAADRLMAIELASTWRAVNDAASEKTRRWAQLSESVPILCLNFERDQVEGGLQHGRKYLFEKISCHAFLRFSPL